MDSNTTNSKTTLEQVLVQDMHPTRDSKLPCKTTWAEEFKCQEVEAWLRDTANTATFE